MKSGRHTISYRAKAAGYDARVRQNADGGYTARAGAFPGLETKDYSLYVAVEHLSQAINDEIAKRKREGLPIPRIDEPVEFNPLPLPFDTA